MPRPALRRRRLALVGFATLISAGALAAPASAVVEFTYLMNPATRTATLTHSLNSEPIVNISVDPKGAGVLNDRLVLNQQAAGCLPEGDVYTCPLSSGSTPIENLIATFGSSGGNQYRTAIDLDRPGLRMRATVVRTQSSYIRLDASATTSGIIATSSVFEALGGADDDALSGDDGANTLTGGPGNDSLVGLKGKDTLLGGPGDDALVPGEGPAGQIVDGGDGSRDTLGFGGDDGPAVISLDGQANDTFKGLALTVTGIEDLGGSDGNDTLIGDAGFNHISGGDGNDTIDGAGGGHDVLRGNAGDDTINARDASALFSDVACGPGNDTAIVDAADLVDPDCETIDRTPAPAGFVAPAFPGGPTTASGAPAGVAATAAASAVQAAVAPAALTLTVPKSIKRVDLRRKGLKLTVASNQSAAVTAELLTTARAIRATRAAAVPKDNVVLARSTKQGVAGARTFTLRPDASLARGATSIAVRITAITSSGVRTVERRSVKLR
jgi:RTX calcium-binding nonapeptide repeat (4 copies)